MQPHTRNREPVGSRRRQALAVSGSSSETITHEAASPLCSSNKRVLFYGLCPTGQEAVRQLDKGTRYEPKGDMIIHQLGSGENSTFKFEGFLRPLDYLLPLKDAAAAQGFELRAIGQLGFERFHPMYNSDDYAEAMAQVQEVAAVA